MQTCVLTGKVSGGVGTREMNYAKLDKMGWGGARNAPVLDPDIVAL